MSIYTSFYPGGWKDLPDTSTPAVAAALNNMDAALTSALPAVQTQTMSTAQGSFAAPTVISILQVSFSAAGRLRLYLSSAARTADSGRAAGTLVTTTGLLYEYVADTSNVDSQPVLAYPGAGLAVFWQLDGGPTVTLNWVQATH